MSVFHLKFRFLLEIPSLELEASSRLSSETEGLNCDTITGSEIVGMKLSNLDGNS